MLILILAGTAAIAIVLITFLVTVIVGIRFCERRMNLTRRPITRAERIARHVLAPEPAARKKEAINKMKCRDNEFARDPARHQPHCPCGALIAKGLRRCRKCRARARYTWQRRHAPATRRNGRPGTGPANREAGK